MSDADEPRPAAPALRASDADRERTAEALRRHTADGRLDTDELEERLGAVYAARSTEQLARLTVDLPALEGPAVPAARAPLDPAVVEARDALRAELVQRGGGAAAISVLCLVIWAATGAGYFWPIWVLLGTGAGVAATWWRGLGPGADPVRELARAEERRERSTYHDPHRKRGGPHF